jgi:hypothetical protein
MLVNGIRYHYRTCSKCGKPFYTAAKYSIPPLCANCRRGKASLALTDEQWKEIKKEKLRTKQ